MKAITLLILERRLSVRNALHHYLAPHFNLHFVESFPLSTTHQAQLLLGNWELLRDHPLRELKYPVLALVEKGDRVSAQAAIQQGCLDYVWCVDFLLEDLLYSIPRTLNLCQSQVLLGHCKLQPLKNQYLQQQAEYALAMEATDLGMWCWDVHSHALSLDPRARQILGIGDVEDALLLQACQQALYPEDLPAVTERVVKAMKEKTSKIVFSHRIVLSNAQVGWVESHGQVLRDATGRPLKVIGTMRDITAYKNLQEKANQNQQLLEKQVTEHTYELRRKNKELGQFNRRLENLLYIISHDIKEPLRAIRGFSALLIKQYHSMLDAKGQDFLERSMKASQRLHDLLDSLIQLTRVQTATIDKTLQVMTSLLQEVLQDLEHFIDRTAARIHMSNDLGSLYVHPTWFKQVLYNIVANAIKFTPSGQAPQIYIEPYQGALCQEGYEGLVIRDRGPGVPPEHQERIFELFQRATTTVEGTGAGLAIVREIITNHGGKVWVENHPEGGACFYILVPEPLPFEAPQP